MRGENHPLLIRRRHVKAHVAEYLDAVEARLAQKRRKRLRTVGALGKAFAAARIQLILPLEEIELDRHTPVLRAVRVLPHAVDIRKVVDKRVVRKHMLVLVGRIGVENKPAVVIQEKRDAPEGLQNLLRTGKVVDAVQRAENRVDRAVQVEALHFLAEEQKVRTAVAGLVLRLGEHRGRAVDTVHIEAERMKRQRQAARSAGEVERKPGFMAEALEERFQISRAAGIVHVRRKRIVIPRKYVVARHYSASPSLFFQRRSKTSV